MVCRLKEWSPRPDLNWWPPRYQRGALPTELHGQMVGMPGLEPGNPEGADLQSAAVAAVPHPHSVFKHSSVAFFLFAPVKRERILPCKTTLVNVLLPAGRIHTTIPAQLQVKRGVRTSARPSKQPLGLPRPKSFFCKNKSPSRTHATAEGASLWL